MDLDSWTKDHTIVIPLPIDLVARQAVSIIRLCMVTYVLCVNGKNFRELSTTFEGAVLTQSLQKVSDVMITIFNLTKISIT